MGTFEPVTVAEITQFGEITEEWLLAMRDRDGALETPTIQMGAAFGTTQAKSYTTVVSWAMHVPAWCERLKVFGDFYARVETPPSVSCSWRLNSGAVNGSAITVSPGNTSSVYLELDVSTLAGTDVTINVQAKVDSNGGTNLDADTTIHRLYMYRTGG